MTQSPPLDTLKHTVLRADELLDIATDLLAGGQGEGRAVDENHPVFEILDAVRAQLFKGAAEQIRGVRWWDGTPQFTAEGREAIRTYSDGSPVVELIESDDGIAHRYFPRLDKDVPRPAPRLSLVGPNHDDGDAS